MSSFPEEVNIFQFTEQMNGFEISRYIEISVLAFFLYDSLLCIAREIDLVWTRSFRYMTLLYFITRHMMLVSLVIDVIYNPLQPQCSPMEHISDVCKVLANACTLVLLVVCSWAMFDRSKILLTIFGLSALALEGVDCVSAVLHGCASNSYITHNAFVWDISNTISQYAFDTVVMFLVLYNAFCALLFEKNIKALRRRTLANLILFDGLTYYGTLFALSLIHLLLSFKGNPWVKSVARAFIQPFSAIITAHFLLNMRYMEMYPNGTTMVALTTLGLVIDNPVLDSTIKDDDSFLYTPDTQGSTQSLPYYNDTHITDIPEFDYDIENVLPRPPQAFRCELITTTVVDIRDMLEETFWA